MSTQKQDRCLPITSRLRGLLPAIALALAILTWAGPNPPLPAEARTTSASPFSMVIASDPQVWWWREGLDPACNDDACQEQKGTETNEDLVTAMNGVTSLGAWPMSGITQGLGSAILTPSGAIINGDLTAFFHQAQIAEYERIYAGLNYTKYQGLGNHDYANNSEPGENCNFDPIYFPDAKRCAKEAVWWMANQIRNTPNVVRHHVPGFAAVHNQAGYNTRFRIHYFLNGVQASTDYTDEFEFLKWRTQTIPAGATNASVEVQGLVFVDSIELEWHTIRTFNLGGTSGGWGCFKTFGTAFPTDPEDGGYGASTLTCDGPAFPDGAAGSLAYSFEIGDFHFVQLHNWPGFARNFPASTTIEEILTFGLSGSPGYNVVASYDWLTRDTALATAAGKKIIINMHEPQDAGWDLWSQAEFASAIAGKNVVGIFVGHVHRLAGKWHQVLNNGVRDDIPVFFSGSAECEVFLLAQFEEDYYNVAVIDSTGGVPTYAPNNYICDATINDTKYNNNSGISALQFTYDTRLPPDLSIIKRDHGVTVKPGDTLTYELAYLNGGEKEATSVIIVETVPPHTTFNAATSLPDSWSCPDGAAPGTQCIHNLGQVDGAEQGIVRFGVSVSTAPVAAGFEQIPNTATIQPAAGTFDSDTSNNESQEFTPLDAAPDLKVTKVDDADLKQPGDKITYTLTVENTGTQDASGVVLSDVLHVNATFDAASSSPAWVCSGGPPGGNCIYQVGNVGAGDAPQVTFAVDIMGSFPDQFAGLYNQVTVSDDGSGGGDLNFADNTYFETTHVDADRDGVENGDDICPGTLPSQTANARGCSPEQVTVLQPDDSDVDGACNRGASGMCEGLDRCANTPATAPRVTDEGCSQAQLDSDMDGACNRGADGSRSYDFIGLVVDAPLCTGQDRCANTPATQRPVDSNGCSAQQVDSDGDGICNRGVTSELCSSARGLGRAPASATAVLPSLPRALVAARRRRGIAGDS